MRHYAKFSFNLMVTLLHLRRSREISRKDNRSRSPSSFLSSPVANSDWSYFPKARGRGEQLAKRVNERRKWRRSLSLKILSNRGLDMAIGEAGKEQSADSCVLSSLFG